MLLPHERLSQTVYTHWSVFRRRSHSCSHRRRRGRGARGAGLLRPAGPAPPTLARSWGGARGGARGRGRGARRGGRAARAAPPTYILHAAAKPPAPGPPLPTAPHWGTSAAGNSARPRWWSPGGAAASACPGWTWPRHGFSLDISSSLSLSYGLRTEEGDAGPSVCACVAAAARERRDYAILGLTSYWLWNQFCYLHR